MPDAPVPSSALARHTPQPRVAIVHELLTIRGGAERVAKIFADMFPVAPIYTLLYNEAKLGDWFPPERVHTSPLQKFARFSTDHHLYLSRFPSAVEAWDFSGFDLVLSSSSAFAHGIITNGMPKHVSYIHSPARYLWDRTHDVLRGKNLLARLYAEQLFHRLRMWDSEAADRPDLLIAPSREVQRRIELYWRRESQIIHPPIDDFWLIQKSEVRSQKSDYFLIVSTLAPYKRIDLAIKACNQLKLPLKIVGEGQARRSLEKIAGPCIEFLGYKPHDELRELYASAMATIFPGEEDFGLVSLESMACGTPVIAYRGGGALETVIEGKTGCFFDEANPESLAETLKTFDRSAFDPSECHKHAQKFSRKLFEHAMRSHISRLMSQSS